MDEEEHHRGSLLLSEIQKIERQPANMVGGVLRDYQMEGLNWLYKLY
jgi:hypothetical protein